MEKYCILCVNQNLEELTYISNLTKLCDCNPPVHLSCLIKWYIKSGKKCPVCLNDYNTMIPVDSFSPIWARRLLRCGFIVLCLILFLVFMLIVLRSRL